MCIMVTVNFDILIHDNGEAQGGEQMSSHSFYIIYLAQAREDLNTLRICKRSHSGFVCYYISDIF